MGIWHWLRNYANEKIKKEHCHSRKCPNCNLWASEVGGCKRIIDDPLDPFFELMECLNCGHVSRWDCRFMIPFFAKEQRAMPEKIVYYGA